MWIKPCPRAFFKVCCGAQVSLSSQKMLLCMLFVTFTSMSDGPWRCLIKFEIRQSFGCVGSLRLNHEVRALVIAWSIPFSPLVRYDIIHWAACSWLTGARTCQHAYLGGRLTSQHLTAFFPVSDPPQGTSISHQNMINLILFPLMLAWILLERAVTLLLTIRDQFISRRSTVTDVHRDARESGLISLPTEVLYEIVREVECLPPETTQSSGSQRPALALSQ
jgi:hypothetical protein